MHHSSLRIYFNVFLSLLLLLASNSVFAEQEWNWSTGYSYTLPGGGGETGSDRGVAASFGEAQAAMKGACSYCDDLGLYSQTSNLYGPKTFSYRPDPQDTPSDYTEWEDDLQEFLRHIENQFSSSPQCAPPEAKTVSGWYSTNGYEPSVSQKIDIRLTANFFDPSTNSCLPFHDDRFKHYRSRKPICEYGYVALPTYVAPYTYICRGVFNGGITSPAQVCDCDQNYVDGQCVAREASPENAVASQKHGNYLQLSDANNEGLRCGDIVSSNSCPAESSIQDVGLKGNPIHCADGQKTQIETDYKAPVGGLEISRIYTNDPGVDTIGFAKASFRYGLPVNVQLRSAFTIDDPTWLLNIPRLFNHGGDLKSVHPGNGARYVFYQGKAGLPHFGSLEDIDGITVYRALNGTEYHFDADSRITRKQYLNGQYLDYDFISDNETTITDNFGRVLRLTHDTKRFKGKNQIGSIQTITDPDGLVTRFTYDNDGMVSSVTYPGGTAENPNGVARKNYEYETVALPDVQGSRIVLKSITDERGIEYARWSYDNLARGISSTHHNNAEKVEIEFVDDNYDTGEFTSVTRDYREANEFLETEYQFETLNGAKKPIKVTQKSCADCVPATTVFDYTSQGMLDKVEVLGGQITDYNYTTKGLLTSVTEGFGSTDALTTSIAWHADYSLPTRITLPGSTIDYTRDDHGNVLTERVRDTKTWAERTTTYTYNTVGQVLTIDGPRADVSDITEFEYASNGDLIKISNALGHVTQVTQYDASGRALQITDPNGVVTAFAYHPRGWLASLTTAGDTTHYTYNAVGLMTKLKMPNGVELNYDYDTARRLSAITDAIGNKIEYRLDLLGNRTRTDLLDPDGVVKSAVEQAYNNLGQLVSATRANGQQQTWRYDVHGNVTNSTDALGLSSQSQFDALQRLTQQVDPAEYATQYEYNSNQQISKVIDATGKETTYTRNAFGDTTEQISPDTGQQIFTYDLAGNRLSGIDARGVVATYTYDALNRVSSVSFADSADDITYRYDDTSAGNNGIGRLTGVDDESGSAAYRYDAKGQVISETRSINGVEFVTQYSYDGAGLLKQMTYPSGRVINYQRNAAGQIEQVSETGQGVLAQSMSYLPFGPLKSLTYGNGIALVKEYDQDYRLTRNHASSLFDQRYGYTARNNINSIDNVLDPTESQSFAYDALQRLQKTTENQGNEEYTHDAIGNRLTRLIDPTPPLIYDYANSSHRLNSIAPLEEAQPGDEVPPVYATEAISYTKLYHYSPVGERQLYHCPANVELAKVRGVGIYHSFSYLCSAAVHAGYLSHADGGLVLIEVTGPQTSFAGSVQNGVTSNAAGAYVQSYQVLPIPADYTNVKVVPPYPWAQTTTALNSQLGEKFTYVCPPIQTSVFYVYGTDLYASNTSVCAAAVHSDLIDPSVGGEVVATIEPGADSYFGSRRNGITSRSVPARNGSFSLEAPAGSEDELRYRYDSAGNTIRKGDLNFTYDQLGRMKTANRADMSARYVYDANNLRAQKTVDGVTTVYLYDLDGNLIAETDELGNIQREYIYAEGMRLAVVDNGQRYYIHSNHLDAPQALTDSSGAIQWQATVAPFGQMTTSVENVVQNLRFPGQYYDAETGLFYNWNRYYDPEVGRYVSSDPVGLSDGPSTYGYVQGNPLNSYDPNGLTSLSLCANPINAAACAALGGATLDGGINVGVQAYNKGWSCIDWDEAGGKALEGALLGVGGYGVGLGVVKYGGGLLAGLGRGFGGLADDVSKQAAKKAIHKNSLDYVGDTHVYRVKGPNGTHKIGESAQGTRVRDGASIRAEQQARKLTRETGDVYTTVIRKTFPDKASARNYETRLIERFRRIYGEDSLPGNKTNR